MRLCSQGCIGRSTGAQEALHKPWPEGQSVRGTPPPDTIPADRPTPTMQTTTTWRPRMRLRVAQHSTAHVYHLRAQLGQSGSGPGCVPGHQRTPRRDTPDDMGKSNPPPVTGRIYIGACTRRCAAEARAYDLQIAGLPTRRTTPAWLSAVPWATPRQRPSTRAAQRGCDRVGNPHEARARVTSGTGWGCICCKRVVHVDRGACAVGQ
jgi:hypothetical protein